MSTRTSLVTSQSRRGGNTAEIAEGLDTIPLLWVALIGPSDLDSGWKGVSITCDRASAVQRLENNIPYFKELFPELRCIDGCAQLLVSALNSNEHAYLSIRVSELAAMAPDTFVPVLRAAVAAIDNQDPDPSKLDELCWLSDIHDEDMEVERLIGCVLTPVEGSEQLKRHKGGSWRQATPRGTLCPHCGKPLRSAKARQCFECGADWH